MAEKREGDSPVPLNGWKEIAGYLGRSIRSAQRYHRDLGLPVHRIRTAHGHTVYAHRAEIDAWRLTVDMSTDSSDTLASATPTPDEPAASPADSDAITAPSTAAPAQADRIRTPPRLSWIQALLALVVVSTIAVACALYAERFSRRSVVPTHVALSGRTLDALDDTGHVLWTYAFDREISQAIGTTAQVADIDGDGRADVLVVVHFGPTGRSSADSDAVYLFPASGGTPRWTFTPRQAFACGAETFGGPWRADSMAISNDQGSPRVWVAFHHHTWWPSFVVEISATGQTSMRYVQTGWIQALAHWTTASGSYLAAGGVMNEQSRASVTLVDDAGPPAMSPHDDARFNCAGLPTTLPAKVWLFPTLDNDEAAGVAYPFVTRIDPIGQDLKVSVGADEGSVITEITSALELRGFAPGDGYWVRHYALEVAGKLHHTAADCPERTQPQTFQQWASSSGWRSVTVDPTPHGLGPARPRLQ